MASLVRSNFSMAWNTDKSLEEKATRWRKLGELGMEKALRESGSSELSIKAVITLLNAGHKKIDNELLTVIAKRLESDIDNGKCVLLASLGRDRAFPVKSLLLENHDYEHELDEDEAIALCANLNSNPNLQRVHLRHQRVFGTPPVCSLLGQALTTNSVLTELYMPSTYMGTTAVKFLMDGLKRNSTLQLLDIGLNPLFDEGIDYVGQMLSNNNTLKELQLYATRCGQAGAEHMSSALGHNASLVGLTFGCNAIQKAGFTALLTPLMQDTDAEISAGPKNTTLKTLSIEEMYSESVSAESVASMIRTNKTLSEFVLTRVDLKTEDWVEQIIPALKENRTLKCFDVGGCSGLTVEDVFDALMDVVQFSDTGLEEIRLHQTEMSIHAGHVNEELRVNNEYRRRLRQQTQVKSKSGRIVLCGYESAGKTTICQTMRRIEHGTSRSYYWKLVWKSFIKSHPCLRQFLFGKNVYRELQDRTRGFDIVVLSNEPHTISVWDFAGQREYYGLHDYLFPNVKNSCFLYVCSTRFPPDEQNRAHGRFKDRDAIKDEFLFWMRFIASNSKPRRGADGQRLPSVTFVLSKKDTLDAQQLNTSAQWAQGIVSDLSEEFKDVIALSKTVQIVDGHSSVDVKRLLKTVKDTLADILEQPIEYAVCREVRLALESRATENPSMPLVSLRDFKTICETQLQTAITRDVYRAAQMNTSEGRETVLSYLNDVGEIIFLRELDFFVVNPRWFGAGVFGFLVNAFGRERVAHSWEWKGACVCVQAAKRAQTWGIVHDHGFVRKQQVDDLLRKSLQYMFFQQTILAGDKLIDLMIHLQLCFKEESENPATRLFVPALFDDHTDNNDANLGLRKLEWKLERSPAELQNYFGRRLDCENKSLTFLTPGFFPRLQVVLRNFLHHEERKWTENPGFHVGRNLIGFATNGMEVLVESSGDKDFFVDVLVKTSNPREETLQFIEKYVTTTIREFCASPQGCQGVSLVESVIRPVCVKELHLCARRKAHAVLVSDLRRHVHGEHGDLSYKHTWSQEIEGVSALDFALDLLEGQGSYNRFLAAHQVDQPEGSSAATPGILTSYSSQDTSSMQQLPKHFYPTIDDISWIRKLEANANLSNAIPIRLHLMCEDRHGVHKVLGQPGRTIKLNRKSDGKNWPLTKYAVSLLWVGVSSGASFVSVDVSSLPVNDWIENAFSTPEIPIAADGLIRIIDHGRVPGPVSDKEILNLLKRYMQIDPSTQWLKTFLNLQDSENFLSDFQLWKVRYTDTSQISWLCRRHYEEGIRHSIVQSVHYN